MSNLTELEEQIVAATADRLATRLLASPHYVRGVTSVTASLVLARETEVFDALRADVIARHREAVDAQIGPQTIYIAAEIDRQFVSVIAERIRLAIPSVDNLRGMVKAAVRAEVHRLMGPTISGMVERLTEGKP